MLLCRADEERKAVSKDLVVVARDRKETEVSKFPALFPDKIISCPFAVCLKECLTFYRMVNLERAMAC